EAPVLPWRIELIEGGENVLHADPKLGGHGTVNNHVGLQTACLLIGADIDDASETPQPSGNERCYPPQLGKVGAPEGKLIVGFSLPGTDADVLRRDQKHAQAGDRLQLAAQARDYALRRQPSLLQGFERNKQATGIDGG